jgi:3-phenylpropionate/trans-cinnamate dioxygenase ferredoxin component
LTEDQRYRLFSGKRITAWKGRLLNVGGQYYAIKDICTHDGGTLADGEVEGFEIECPRHGARFDLRTGKVTAPPAYEDIPLFAVRIHGDRVQVRDEDNVR